MKVVNRELGTLYQSTHYDIRTCKYIGTHSTLCVDLVSKTNLFNSLL